MRRDGTMDLAKAIEVIEKISAFLNPDLKWSSPEWAGCSFRCRNGFAKIEGHCRALKVGTKRSRFETRP